MNLSVYNKMIILSYPGVTKLTFRQWPEWNKRKKQEVFLLLFSLCIIADSIYPSKRYNFAISSQDSGDSSSKMVPESALDKIKGLGNVYTRCIPKV